MRPTPTCCSLPILLATLASCAGGGPRPTAFDDRPSVPVRLADLAEGRVGAVDLDRIDPGPASRLRLPKPFRSADDGDGWRNHRFDPPSPIARVRQIRAADDPTVAAGAVCVLRPGDAAADASRVAELAEAGLAPLRVAGVAGLRGAPDEVPALLATTADPATLLAFRDDRLVAVVQERVPGAVAAGLPRYVAPERLPDTIAAASTERLRALLRTLRQDLPLDGRTGLVDLARNRLVALDVASWAGLEDRARDWDARFEAADLESRLALMVEQAALLQTTFPTDLPLEGKAATWRTASWQALRRDLADVLAPATAAGAQSAWDVLERFDGFARADFGTLLDRAGRDAWRHFAARLAWEQARMAVVVADDPFTSARNELALLQRTTANGDPRTTAFEPDSPLIARCLEQAARRLRRFAERGGSSLPRDPERATALASALEATLPDQLDTARNDSAAFVALRSHLAAPITGADAEAMAWTRLAPGLRGLAGADRPTALRDEARQALDALARRAGALGRVAGSPTDRATLRAFTDALRLEPVALDVLVAGFELLEAARRLDLAPALPWARRLDDLEQFANRQQRFGPLAAMVAAELALPLGRELATEADRFTTAGAHARAAELLLAAASVGSADGPAPKDSAALRREAAALRSGAADPDAGSAALRAWWLHRAQVEVLRAVAPLLPPIADDDPLVPLQARFVARQLGGTARWPQRYGLRLVDQTDVQRALADATPVRLGTVDGAPRWVAVDADAPALTAATLGADPADWEAIAGLAEDVVAAREALATARAGRDLSRPELEDRDRLLMDRIRELEVAIDRGQLDPLTARTRIDRLQREAAALRALLANYNDRTRHIQSRTAAYNDRVVAYNDALRDALQQLGTAFRNVLVPATQAWIEQRLDALPLDDAERRLRAALTGVGPADFARAPRPAHPVAVAARVRDLTCATPAAEGLAAALGLRLADDTYNAGVAATEHVARLAPAFDLYATDHGAEAFARLLLRGTLADLPTLHDACVAAVRDESLRRAIERLR